MSWGSCEDFSLILEVGVGIFACLRCGVLAGFA